MQERNLLMLDIYTSISNQFKPEGDIVDGKIHDVFQEAGYDVALRRFKGGKYTSKKQVVGTPDVLIAHIDEEGTKVGKGSLEEVDYAIHSGILVLLATEEGIYTYKSCSNINSKDWRFHANLEGDILTPSALKYLLKSRNILPEDDPFFPEGSDHQKGSDKNMLL
jgi:hypothetical protein